MRKKSIWISHINTNILQQKLISRFLFRLYLNTSIKDAQKKAFIYGKRSIKAVPVDLLHTKTEVEIKGNTFPFMERYDKYASIFFGKT